MQHEHNTRKAIPSARKMGKKEMPKKRKRKRKSKKKKKPSISSEISPRAEQGAVNLGTKRQTETGLASVRLQLVGFCFSGVVDPKCCASLKVSHTCETDERVRKREIFAAQVTVCKLVRLCSLAELSVGEVSDS